MELKEKLMLIQNELKCPKDQFNSFGKYHYRSTESILEGLKPLLLKHKATLIISDEIVQVGDRYYVKATAELVDAEKEIEIVMSTAYAREEETKKGMDGSQITGSASSYARKYALNGLFAIDDTKDSDAMNTHGKQATEPVKGKRLDQTSNDLITEKQRKLLFARSKDKGIGEDVVKLLLGNYGYESSKDIKKSDFNNILKDLEQAKPLKDNEIVRANVKNAMVKEFGDKIDEFQIGIQD